MRCLLKSISDAVERAVESEVHQKVDRPAHLASAEAWPSNTRGAAVSQGSRHSIARSPAERQCDSPEWRGEVRPWSIFRLPSNPLINIQFAVS